MMTWVEAALSVEDILRERARTYNKAYRLKNRERLKVQQKVYRQSPAARAAHRVVVERYNHSDKGRATQQRYRRTDGSRATQQRYRDKPTTSTKKSLWYHWNRLLAECQDD